MKVLKARNEGDDQESRIRQLTPVLKKARYKIGDSTRKPSHKQAKSSTGSWKANECLKLDAPEVAKLNIPLSLPSNTQLVSFFWTSTKALLWKGTGMIIFLRWMPKIFFFQLPKVNKYSLGVELAPAQQVIKKLKMDHLWVYTLCPTPCCNGYRRW